MIDPSEKSTGLSPAPVAACEIDENLVLDGRLALYHRRDRWLALSDLHFGYEVSRRRDGALWPLWGASSIAERLESLLDDYRPQTLVLVGDVVDSSAAPAEAISWLQTLHRREIEIILIEGNHDRGACRREFVWKRDHRIEDMFFEHGHLPGSYSGGGWRVSGHLHPSVNFRDGAGTRLRLPSLVVREDEDGSREIILPAFSPWAGGGAYLPPVSTRRIRQWAASPRRVFEVID